MCSWFHYHRALATVWLAFGVFASWSVTQSCWGDSFEQQIIPLLKQHCVVCHSTEKAEGELDLERFLTTQNLFEDPAIWESVAEQVSTKQMPPKEKPALSLNEQDTLLSWVESALEKIAIAQQGDPGPVVLRRLSNAEYTYTIRDLTGLQGLDPAKEFPVDGAAGEGFTNVGAALVMSPALITKYMDAAKAIASHVMLLPKGIRFSEAISERDRTEEILAKIRAIYRDHTDAGGATAVNLQGIQFATNEGGRLPVNRYLEALVQEREPLQSGSQTFESLAVNRKLSAKYLRLLWSKLHENTSSFLMKSFQEKWQQRQLTIQDIEPWQNTLWRFTSVGHIGKVNGPKLWQEPASPLVTEQEHRFKLASTDGVSDIVVYLDVTTAMDGEQPLFAIWENLRIVAPDQPDVPLDELREKIAESKDRPEDVDPNREYGVDESKFRRRPHAPGHTKNSLVVESPSRIEVRLPGWFVQGAELVATGRLHPGGGQTGAVQMQMLSAEQATTVPHRSSTRLVPQHPVLISEGPARALLEDAFDDFRQTFPIALCYPKIVPVDEVVTLSLFYREDHHLKRLVLDDAESLYLDQLWDDLLFVSEAPLKQVDAFDQLYQYATQDADPSVFEPLREPITRAADDFRKLQIEAESRQLESVIDFASLAWRRPTHPDENASLRSLYKSLRDQDLSHESAVRMLVARLFVSPDFLYRREKAESKQEAAPVSDFELATRLSYFLWSSSPDPVLRSIAAEGQLHQPEVLRAQVRRMLGDDRARRLALEFGCQWLGVRDIATMDEKSERHFPTFHLVRSAMQEEATLFFTDLFQRNGSVLSLIDAKHTFVNRALADHYGFAVTSDEWTRVSLDDHRERGGVLGFASTLSKQSGASRTSPILRGYWVSEVLLGERLPKPPKGVPVLPEETKQGLTERQMTQRHSSDERCAHCHQRIDPIGFALEGFDAIGRARSKDAVGQSIDTRATLFDGTQLEGFVGLKEYLLKERRDDFLRQFCRKLLGYALGRSVQLSDKPLLDTMQIKLRENNYQVHTAIELIVTSPQFQQIRAAEPF